VILKFHISRFLTSSASSLSHFTLHVYIFHLAFL